MNTLSVQNLSLTYKNGVQALQDINLHITNGMFGLLGPNGAGKSSLMKTIVGLQKPISGTILFNKQDVLKEPRHLQQHLGFLPQDFGVYPKISAYRLLDHLARLKGITQSAERKQQINYLLERVNLTAQRHKEVATFSGGMRQRFGVAQALLGNPNIIIVDEPTAGLDPEERNRFNMLLNEISEDIIVVLSTHLVEDVRHLCSEMAIMNKGKVLAAGQPGNMIRELEGKIWYRQIDLSDIQQYAEQYRIISQQLVARRLHITICQHEMPPGFQPLSPTLEHVYFNALQTNS
jgi:ABC-type multidrug transport system ATPase subunit